MEPRNVMIVRMINGHEGRNDLIFQVDDEGVKNLGQHLLQFTEFPDSEMPQLKVEMVTKSDVEEADRIGEEMA